jgi:hypothetical protein
MRPGGQRYAIHQLEQQLQHNQREQQQQNQQLPQQQHPLNETKVTEEAEVEFIPADSSARENAPNNGDERKEDDQTARGRFEVRTSDGSASQGRHAQTLMEVEAVHAEPRPGPQQLALATARLRRNEETPLQRNSTISSVQFENNERFGMRSTDVSAYRERRQARDWGHVEQEEKSERQSKDVYAFEESRHPRSGGAQVVQEEKLESRPTDVSAMREVRGCVHDVQTCMLNIAHELDRGHRAHSHLHKVNVVLGMFYRHVSIMTLTVQVQCSILGSFWIDIFTAIRSAGH